MSPSALIPPVPLEPVDAADGTGQSGTVEPICARAALGRRTAKRSARQDAAIRSFLVIRSPSSRTFLRWTIRSESRRPSVNTSPFRRDLAEIRSFRAGERAQTGCLETLHLSLLYGSDAP